MFISRLHRSLAPQLDGKADFFIQVGKIPSGGKALALKSQVHFDNLPSGPVRVMENAQVYGQTVIGTGEQTLKIR